MELSTYSKNVGTESDMLNRKMQLKLGSIRNEQLWRLTDQTAI